MKLRHLALALLGASLAASAIAKEGNATAAEATAMVKKGVAFIKANGKDKGYAEISNKAGQFTDRDLYLVVYGLDGTVRAHGANEKMIGKNLIELKDVDGKPFVKERVELAQSQGHLLAGLQVHQPGEQEDRAQEHVLREARRRRRSAAASTSKPTARIDASLAPDGPR